MFCFWLGKKYTFVGFPAMLVLLVITEPMLKLSLLCIFLCLMIAWFLQLTTEMQSDYISQSVGRLSGTMSCLTSYNQLKRLLEIPNLGEYLSAGMRLSFIMHVLVTRT